MDIQISFIAGAMFTLMLGTLVYVFIMTLRSIKKFNVHEGQMDFLTRSVEEFSSKLWRHREEMDRANNDRFDRMEMNAYQHMKEIESRIEKLEEKIIVKEGKKDLLKG